MAEPRDLGALRRIAAGAIGEPGRRRFRLMALSQEGAFSLMWLEKEQLAALGDAIETVLDAEHHQPPAIPPDDVQAVPDFPASADLEFRVAQLSMGVDQRRGRMVIVAAGAEEAGDPSVSMEIGFRAGQELREQISAVLAAGRPPCPLCGGPVDPQSHVCPRHNGHHQTT